MSSGMLVVFLASLGLILTVLFGSAWLVMRILNNSRQELTNWINQFSAERTLLIEQMRVERTELLSIQLGERSELLNRLMTTSWQDFVQVSQTRPAFTSTWEPSEDSGLAPEERVDYDPSLGEVLVELNRDF